LTRVYGLLYTLTFFILELSNENRDDRKPFKDI
jgi:hypothetical protein